MDREHIIAAYFSNTLTDVEKETFDHLLKTDAPFQAEVAFQKKLEQTIQRRENLKLKKRLNKLESKLKSERGIGFSKLWLVAASIAVLLAITFFFSQNKTSEDLFATYYNAPANIVHPIVRSGDESTKKTKAFIAYANQNYSEAHLLFSSLYEQNQNSEILFYDAISLLEIDSTTTAIAKLKTHQKFNDAVSDKTQWYLALALLKNKDTEMSRETLKNIVERKTYNYEKAQKLLSEIN